MCVCVCVVRSRLFDVFVWTAVAVSCQIEFVYIANSSPLQQVSFSLPSRKSLRHADILYFNTPPSPSDCHAPFFPATSSSGFVFRLQKSIFVGLGQFS